MTYVSRRAVFLTPSLKLLVGAAAAAFFAQGCGGPNIDYQDPNGGGSSPSTGGATLATGGAGGVGTGGAVATGGAISTGGSAVGGSAGSSAVGGETGSLGQCLVDSDCLAVVATDAACFSPSCSAPVAASKSDVAKDSCLVPWTPNSAVAIPAGCQFEGDIACPTLCALPPACVRPYCTDNGQCAVELGYTDDSCDDEPSVSTSCDELEKAFNQALTDARGCLAGGIVASTECDPPLSVQDLCGCSQVINNSDSVKAQLFEAARVAYESQCKQPAQCQLLDCGAPTMSGSCQLTTQPYGICVYN